MSKKIIIVYYNDDSILKKLSKFDEIYCLNQNIYNFLRKSIPKRKLIKCNIKLEDKKKIINKEILFTKKLNSFIKLNSIDSLSSKNIKYLLNEIFRVINNIEIALPKNKNLYLYVDKKILLFEDKFSLINYLMNIFNKKNHTFFSIFPKYNKKYITFFIKLNNLFVNSLLKKKKFYYISSPNYNKIIRSKFILKDYYSITPYPSLEFNLYKVLQIMFHNFFSKNLFMIHNQFFFKLKLKHNFNYSVFSELYQKYIDIIINITKSINLDIKNYIDYKNYHFGIFDNHRPIIQTSYAYNAFNKKKITILIPQGSVSIQKNKFYKYEIDKLANGIAYSDLCTHVVAQSKISFNFLSSLDKDFEIIKNKPIFWNYIEQHQKTKKSYFKFLIASTLKNLRTKNLIYEDSFEFYDLIEQIHNFLREKTLQNIKFVIRFRDNLELKEIDINKFLMPGLLELSDKKSLNDDFRDTDILLSNSSTCIEEALNSFIPIALLSSNGYSHFVNDNLMNIDKYPIFKINYQNLSADIIKITKSINANQHKYHLFNRYIWTDENQSFRNFLNGYKFIS